MKLRISGNSIRLRLLRSEVRTIGIGEPIEVRTNFLPNPLTYRFEPKVDSAQLTATFANHTLLVSIPLSVAAAWADGDEVGMEADVDGADGNVIRLLIEKDFRCLHGEQASDADCYPNPRDNAEAASNGPAR